MADQRGLQCLGAAKAGDPLRGLFFRAGRITQDLCHENLDVHPIGVPGRQLFGDFKCHAMLLFQEKAHCEVTRRLIVARGDDRPVAEIIH